MCEEWAKIEYIKNGRKPKFMQKIVKNLGKTLDFKSN